MAINAYNLHNRSDISRNQSIPNTTSSGSGDDHLLTAQNGEEPFHEGYCHPHHHEYINYHDNHAFQFYNNNNNNHGNEQRLSKWSKNIATTTTPTHRNGDFLKTIVVHHTGGSGKLPEQADNSTQTCNAFEELKKKMMICGNGKAHIHLNCLCNPSHVAAEGEANAADTIGLLQMDSETAYKPLTLTPAQLQMCRVILQAQRCNCSSLLDAGHNCLQLQRHLRVRRHIPYRSTSTRKQRRSAHRYRHHHHHHAHDHPHPHSQHQPTRKRSLQDSSSLTRHPTDSQGSKFSPARHPRSSKRDGSVLDDDEEDRDDEVALDRRTIAIEIDPTTVTEDNATTGTSNFAYRLPNEVVGNTRTEHRLRRHSSMNSNTTIETDEFSNDEEGATEFKDRPDVLLQKNASVTIKRKYFRAPGANDDYCSSCSHCSSCSCLNDRTTSSCSSVEEWTPETQRRLAREIDRTTSSTNTSGHQRTRKRPQIRSTNISTAFSVCSSDTCQPCRTQYHSTVSSGEELIMADSTLGRKVSIQDSNDKSKTRRPNSLMQDRPNSSTKSSIQSSRRSSVSVSTSFCSCNSNSCYCCSSNYIPAVVANHEKAYTKDTPTEDLQHSLTLTPLTNPSSLVSTPVTDDGDLTIQTISNLMEDDNSSQSHSAEYFSLSSNTQPSQGTPRRINPQMVMSTNNGQSHRLESGSNEVRPPDSTSSLPSRQHASKQQKYKQDDDSVLGSNL